MDFNFTKKSVVALAVMALGSGALYAAPDNNDPYAGQYEVLTMPEHASRAWRQGELIVKLRTEDVAEPVKLKRVKGNVKANASAGDLNSLLSRYGAEEAEQLMPLTGDVVTPKARRAKSFDGKEMSDSDLSGLYVLRLDAAKASDMKSVAQEFAELPEVEYAEPNYLVYSCSTGTAADYTSDPMYSQQWGIPAINLDKLWNAPVINPKRPVIAILDTGVDIEHPDLADNIWTNELEANGTANIDDDGNGFYDDVHGWDFVNQTGRMRDNNGHGTHCAGIAAAVGGNGIGITGANPDALIMPITVMQSDGTGDIGTIIKGIDYAVANGADVLSMSFGGASESRAQYDALAKAYHMAILVAAAGNNTGDVNACHHRPTGPMFPGAYNFVLGVMASDSDGILAGFSNWDCDGPLACGPYSNEQLYGYEVMAPGVNILSTYPGGGYKSLHGTSMACPLVAGAVSRLYQCKDILSKELLFGDLIHTLAGGLFGSLDIAAAYKITDGDRTPILTMVTYRLDDSLGDNDLRADAGETIDLYPTIRNFWGQAKNVKIKLSVGENEDPDIVEFITPEVSFNSELSSYSLNESKNPFRFKISDNCVDGRHVRLAITATCDNISEEYYQEFVISVENGIELCGILNEDMTLYPDKHYIVPTKFGVPQGKTLTILPGVTIKFKDGAGLIVNGGLIAHGEPGKMITFTKGDLDQGYIGELGFNDDDMSYVKFDMLVPGSKDAFHGRFTNCIFENIPSTLDHIITLGSNSDYNKCLFYGNTAVEMRECSFQDCTFINQYWNTAGEQYIPSLFNINESILFNNRYRNVFTGETVSLSGACYGLGISVYTPDQPSYFGSSLESKVRSTILDVLNPCSASFTQYDLTNMLKRPPYEAHGIVWKVVVDGYDAQDEFDQLPDLGVGRHKFEVYFSKPMNRKATPFLSMGVRPPYTQIAIAEDAGWRSETIDGDVVDVYTAYLTIKGSDTYDGLNRIYVADAEDTEYFFCPIEDSRFNVNVQSAGSMSAGFMAEAGVGKVSLTWDSPKENFDDMLGYNVYRYVLDENRQPGDTIRINDKLLTMEEFVDYDIVPGTTYNYFYKVLRTSLEENSPSRVVSATPRAAGKGDANASGNVDVADVVTEVNYMVGRDPKPFIFDAADINNDEDIDILDVVGTVNIIMNPEGKNSATSIQSVASYTIEDGILYVDSPVELAGVQAELTGKRGMTEISVLSALRGMENTGDWISDESYRFLAFSLSGKTLESGRHPLLAIGNADIDRLILVDAAGNGVMAIEGSANGISSVVLQQMKVPTPNPFVNTINVPVLIGTSGNHSVELSLVDLSGAKMYSFNTVLGFGEHTVTLEPSSVSSGFYMLVLTVDGKAVQTHKVIKK